MTHDHPAADRRPPSTLRPGSRSVPRLGRGLAILALGGVLAGGSGCATIVKGTAQTVTIHKDDPKADVRYYGQPVPNGKLFRAEKRHEPPHVVYRTAEGDFAAPLTYDVDPLLYVDFLLLIPFVIPGLVALSVDFSTGAWRDLHVHQHPTITAAKASKE